MTTGTAPAPAGWFREMIRFRSARFAAGHSIRSGVSVGGPFIVGAATGHIIVGMWIGLACLVIAPSERPGSYRLNFVILAVSTPIAASAYLLGFIQDAPLPALVALMTVLALFAGLISGWGPGFSVASMQFLLLAAVALGVPGIDDWWVPFGLYLAGALLYAALLAVEMAVFTGTPERAALADLMAALADLAAIRADDIDQGAGDDASAVTARTVAVRRRVTGALAQAKTQVRYGSVRRRSPGGGLDSEVVDRAESVMAALIGDDDPADLRAAGERLGDCAAQARRRRRDAAAVARRHESVAGSRNGLAGRVSALEEAVAAAGRRHRSELVASSPQRTPRERLAALRPSHEVTVAALRLALCYGVAVAAKAYFPFNHWFWVPLTVALVMKPEFGSVFSRAVLRVIGTAVGVLIATLAIVLIPKGIGLGVVITLLAASVPWMMARSYTLQAVAIAPIVLLLVDEIVPAGGTADYAWQRLGATVVGGAVVIVFGYLIWPHSRRADTSALFAAAVRQIADELRLAGAPDRPQAPDAGTAAVTARRAGYQQLAALRGRLERHLVEPPPAGTVAREWLPVADAADRLADEVTAYADARERGAAAADPVGADLLAGRLDALTGHPLPAAETRREEPLPAVSEPLVAVREGVAHLGVLVDSSSPPSAQDS